MTAVTLLLENKLMYVVVGGHKIYYVVTKDGMRDSDKAGTVKSTYNPFPKHCQLFAANEETDVIRRKNDSDNTRPN